MQIIRLVILLAVSIGVLGTANAIFNPESTLAGPFKTPAVVVLQAAAEADKLFAGASATAATMEMQTVSTALLSLNINEGITSKPVSVPTNDMSSFPSKEHPLYPVYLKTDTSQFMYFINEKGEAEIDTSEAKPNQLLEAILQRISQLQGETPQTGY
jgi:hypothetical protein